MPIRSYRNYFLRGVCTCYASPISSMSYTCHRHVRSSDRIAAIFACLSACAPAIGLLIPNNRSSRIVPRPIYIYISSISDLWIISSSIVSHPLPLFVHNRHKNRTFIHREYYYNIIFLFFYIYFFHHTNTFLPIIYLQFARDVASRAIGWIRIRGEDTDHHAIYLSILFRLAISPSFFGRFFEREKEAKRRTDGECTRFPEKRIRESISLKRSQSLGVFAHRGKGVEMGEGKGGRGRGGMKTRKHRSSRLQKVPERTILLFSPHVPPHFSLTAFILFTAFPEILAYHRSIFLECVYQNDYENDERYCQANYDEHQFLRTKYRELPSLVDITHRSCVEERER